MSAVPNPQPTRLDFRLSPEHKSLIERAAAARGQTVSSFALSTLIQAAEEAIQHETRRTLSARDSEVFLTLLDSAREPNAALMKAAKRYKARHGR